MRLVLFGFITVLAPLAVQAITLDELKQALARPHVVQKVENYGKRARLLRERPFRSNESKPPMTKEECRGVFQKVSQAFLGRGLQSPFESALGNPSKLPSCEAWSGSHYRFTALEQSQDVNPFDLPIRYTISGTGSIDGDQVTYFLGADYSLVEVWWWWAGGSSVRQGSAVDVDNNLYRLDRPNLREIERSVEFAEGAGVFSIKSTESVAGGRIQRNEICHEQMPTYISTVKSYGRDYFAMRVGDLWLYGKSLLNFDCLIEDVTAGSFHAVSVRDGVQKYLR